MMYRFYKNKNAITTLKYINLKINKLFNIYPRHPINLLFIKNN